MVLTDKKNAFVKLGLFLKQFTAQPYQVNNAVLFNEVFFDDFEQLIARLDDSNSWFTREQLEHAFLSWSNALTVENLDRWLRVYDLKKEPRSEEHTSELQSRPHLVCRLLLEKKKEETRNIT